MSKWEGGLTEGKKQILEEVDERLEQGAEYFEQVLEENHEDAEIYELDEENKPDLDEVDFSEYSVRVVGDLKIIFSGPGRNTFLGSDDFHDRNKMSTSDEYDENDEIIEEMVGQYIRYREEELS